MSATRALLSARGWVNYGALAIKARIKHSTFSSSPLSWQPVLDAQLGWTHSDTPMLLFMHTQGKVWPCSHCWVSVWFTGCSRRRLAGGDAGILCTSINLRWISDSKCPAPNILQYNWEQNITPKYKIYCCCLHEKTILCNFHNQWGRLRPWKQTTLWVAGCSSQVSYSSTE